MVKYFLNTKEMIAISSFAHTMWDRNEILTPNTNIVVATQIGKLGATKSFEDICLDRARDLYSLVKDIDKKIYLFWSGGLDSTTAFLCFREVVPKDKLCVFYTQKSKEEYPFFFENNIENVYESIEFSMHSIWKAVIHGCTNGITVTGEIGDQLFGSNLWLKETKETLQKPWREYKNIATLENIEEFIAKCPYEIKNVAEMLWWINYSLKYQWVQFRMLCDNEVSMLNINMFHFFDTDEFNDYAVSTPITEKMLNYDVSTYKYPIRNLIYKLSNDKEYAYKKEKVGSWSPKYGRLSKALMATSIDTNWVRAYK